MAGTGKTYLLDAARACWEADGYRVLGAALSGKAAKGLEDGSGIESRTCAKFLMDLRPGEVSPEKLREKTFHSEAAKQKYVEKVLQPNLRIDKAFSRGDAAEALEGYSKRGLVHVADDRAGAMRELIERWREKAQADPAGCLIFAGEKREVAALNRMAQAERARDGRLGSKGMAVGDDVFHAGDRVLFTRNSRVLGLRNGDLGTVVEVRPVRGQVAVRLDSGQVVVVPLGDYDHVKLGYAITTHKGQGVTCEAAFILAGGSMQDRHLTYVQASRARGETRLFIDKPEAGDELTLVARRMEQERFKEMASEILRQSPAAHQLRHGSPEVH